MRSKNFNDALKKAINGNWSFAHIKLTYEEKRGPEPKVRTEKSGEPLP